MAINSTPESTGVTDFVQEACSQVEVLGAHHRPSKLFKAQGDVQNLTEYFARPRLISTNTLPATRSTILNTIYPVGSILLNFPGAAGRLNGVFGMKFTTVFTLQVAATPFHQGILALSWQYGNNSTDYQRTSKPYSCTNVPHVRLDLSVDTMVQLKIPWLNPYEFSELNGVAGPTLGYLGLNTLSAIPIVAGMNLPSYKLYIHLEDVEFSGAYPSTANVVVFQSGSPINKEVKQAGHPYSSQVSTISSALRMVARGVPSLSGIAGTVAWYTDAMAGGLRAFGFSKPTILDPATRMLKQANALENNVDLASPVTVVGPLSTNALQVDDNFSSSAVDEMSLAYVLSQPCQISYGTITSAQTSGTLIYAGLVSPSACWYRELSSAPYCNIGAPISLNGVAGNSFFPSGLFYFGSMFRCWRGDITYRFTFAKTKMHGGRVMVAFTPSYRANGFSDTIPAAVAGPEIAPLQPYSQSKLLDLKDNNIFEFTVPYVSTFPNNTFTDSIGAITMHIMDPLQVSAVVSTSINFFVEAYASPNFELSVPRGPVYPAHELGNVRTQSGESSIKSSTPDDSSKYTIGEKILSVKQLIMIPQVTDVTIAQNVRYANNVYPWYFQPTLTTTSPTPVNYLLPFGSFGYGGNIAACYSFARGGTDLHLYGPQSNQVTASASSNDYGSTSPSAAPTAATVLNGPNSNLPIVTQTDTSSLHVRYPAYQRLARIWSTAYNINNTWSFFTNALQAPSGAGSPALVPWLLPALPSVNINNLNGPICTARFARNAADDAMLGMYNGPAPLYLPNLASTQTVYDQNRVI